MITINLKYKNILKQILTFKTVLVCVVMDLICFICNKATDLYMFHMVAVVQEVQQVVQQWQFDSQPLCPMCQSVLNPKKS